MKFKFRTKNKTSNNIKRLEEFKIKFWSKNYALSNDEKYLFATLNSTSELAIIDTQSMKILEKHKVTSFPVGLAVSKENKYLAVTSQR